MGAAFLSGKHLGFVSPESRTWGKGWHFCLSEETVLGSRVRAERQPQQEGDVKIYFQADSSCMLPSVVLAPKNPYKLWPLTVNLSDKWARTYLFSSFSFFFPLLAMFFYLPTFFVGPLVFQHYLLCSQNFLSHRPCPSSELYYLDNPLSTFLLTYSIPQSYFHPLLNICGVPTAAQLWVSPNSSAWIYHLKCFNMLKYTKCNFKSIKQCRGLLYLKYEEIHSFSLCSLAVI